MLSILLWALSYFPDGDLETSYLARLGHGLAPVGEPLGLDWRLLVALLASFIAKENAIAALGILYGTGMSGDGLAATLAASIPTASALSFIAATLLFIPCIATCAVMHKELGDRRWMLFAVTLHGVIAVTITALIYHLSSV